MRLKSVSCALLIVPFLAAAALAQGVPITTDGVYIDSNGVLNTRKKQDSRLAEIRKNAAKMKKDNQLVYVSLPRIFAEARKLQTEGKELPDRIKYLHDIG